MRPFRCPACNYHIPLGDLILNRDLEIGNGATVRGNVLFYAIWTNKVWIAWHVANKIGSDNVVDQVKVALVKGFFQ